MCIRDRGNPELQDLEKSYTNVDEVPFDFERRRMSVVVEDQKGKRHKTCNWRI